MSCINGDNQSPNPSITSSSLSHVCMPGEELRMRSLHLRDQDVRGELRKFWNLGNLIESRR